MEHTGGRSELKSSDSECSQLSRPRFERLWPLVYDELRAVARSYMRGQIHGHTLQPTALVNEAYVRLTQSGQCSFRDRTHLFAAAAQAIRHILVDHARARTAKKRPSASCRIALRDDLALSSDSTLDLLALDEALQRLSACGGRYVHIVELRFFGGLTLQQAAKMLNVSRKTAVRDWQFARAWLSRELSSDPDL